MSNVQLPELGNKQGFDEATAQAFMDDARNRILSLGTNQTDLIGFTQEAMLGEQYAGLGDEYKSLVLQSLMNLRNQVVIYLLLLFAQLEIPLREFEQYSLVSGCWKEKMEVMMAAKLRDLLLPFFVVAVVGMMIFPLPLFILDILLVCNISFALALLVSSVYLAQPEKFTSLPSLLLLTTIFRLGLNVSTTRQLLATGDAPEVIATFGSFVVQGNLVVGVTVFIILTLVQFLVIAKGAERVAEVAARFTLDAMPGKQMSIDADIRGGILSLSEAKEKRRQLHKESKLFGALDGAMKFVKGDVIAGLLIIVLNITAGLYVGVQQQGLEFSEAIRKYTMFTIGDGLASQIPALLVAVAAGIAVTRVSDLEGSFIGRDIFAQLGREPQALATTACVLVLLGFVPGLPVFPLLLLGVLFACAARRGKLRQEQTDRMNEEQVFRPKVLSTVALRMSPSATLQFQKEATLPGLLRELRHQTFEKRGVILPDVQFDVDREEIRTVVFLLFHGTQVEVCEWDGMQSLSVLVANRMKRFIISNTDLFIDDLQTRTLLDVHSPVVEPLVNTLIPEKISITEFSKLLRQLICEGVSVREFDVILQSVAEAKLREEAEKENAGSVELLAREGGASEKKFVKLLSSVRQGLSRSITQSVFGGQSTGSIYVLGASLDRLLSQSFLAGVPLDPETTEKILLQVKMLEEKAGERIVLVTSSLSRILLFRLLQKSLEKPFSVLSPEEIHESISLKIIEEVTIELPKLEIVKDRGEHSEWERSEEQIVCA